MLGARLMKNAQAGVRRIAVAELAQGTLNPSPLAPNVTAPDDLSRAIELVSGSLGKGGGRVGLLLPDGAVRVNLLEFETLPSKTNDLESLLRWRLKESLGFAPEDARLSYQENFRDAGRVELLVLSARTDVLAQFAAAVEPVRGAPVLTLPVTMALLPLIPDSERGGQLLTHVCSGYVTHALVDGKRLRLWRTRVLDSANGVPGLASVVSEAVRAAASARDRFGIEVTRAWLCCRPAADESLQDSLSESLGVTVENLPSRPPVNPDKPLHALLDADQRAVFGMFGAPIAGLIANAGLEA